ncbi:MAG: outer membrane protein assembly factor BamC [Proteobacteria bacterium]|nr:outer membrane protein assembly factor BamC [Pseudomonadota bacterium]
MGFTLRIAVLVLAGLLAGCGANKLLEPKKIDYKSAGSLPPLEVPPDLTNPTRDNRYVVPGTGKAATTLSVYETDRAARVKAGRGDILPAIANMKIERSGNERWLVVAEPPEKLWELVKDFWQENGFLLKVERPESGVMETDWAENRAKIPKDFLRSMLGKLIDQLYSTAERDKFRTRLERTADGKGTELYLSHRGMIEVYSDQLREQTVWQPRAPDPDLEAEFLRRLMVRLGAQEERAQQILARQAQPSRASISRGANGAELLDMAEPFDRAWRRVGLALDRVGFTVEDRDRRRGLYYVRYADPNAEMDKARVEKPGLLSKLAFWKKDEQVVKAEQYRVRVEESGEASRVIVLDKDGLAETSGTTRRILSLLHEQLK